MKASSISVIPCALQSFFARQIRALFMADLVRLVKWQYGLVELKSSLAVSKWIVYLRYQKRIIMKKFYLCLFKNRMKQ